MRVSVAVAVLSLFLIAPTAAAFYADQEFVPYFFDQANDSVGFTDLHEVAIAEPGDGTAVFRITVADTSLVVPPGAFDVVFFYPPDGTWFAPGCADDGTPDYFGNADSLVPIACAMDGTEIFFLLTYDMLKVAPGDTADSWGVAYAYTATGGSLVMDAGGPGPSGLLTDEGQATYTFTGCTKAGGCSAEEVIEDVSQTFYFDILDVEASIGLGFSEATSDSYHYNWTSSTEEVHGMFNATTTSGAFTINVMDESGAAVFTGSSADWQNATETFTDAMGNWSVAIDFADFVGTVGFDLTPVYAEGETPPEEPSPENPEPETEGEMPETEPETGGEENGTADEKGEDSPALPLAVAMVALVALAARRRQA